MHALPLGIDVLTLEGALALRLRGPGAASATLLLRGAQLISWTDGRGIELLYRSPLSPLAGSQPVRGGVPVVFPQFGAHGPLPRHGFARTAVWGLHAAQVVHGTPSVTLRLQVLPDTHADWSHGCLCDLTVALGAAGLTMTLQVHNTGTTALQFSAALHAYFAVGQIATARLTGVLPGGQTLALGDAIDQVFAGVSGPLQLQSAHSRLRMAHTGFGDVVVWNPGPGAGLADLPANGHEHFVCVEAAAIAPPVGLAPGGVWQANWALESGY